MTAAITETPAVAVTDTAALDALAAIVVQDLTVCAPCAEIGWLCPEYDDCAGSDSIEMRAECYKKFARHKAACDANDAAFEAAKESQK
jgi:hypothetical protein